MAKASDNQFPYIHLVPAAAPANPTAGERLYLDSGDGNKLKRRSTTGTVTTIEGGGGGTTAKGVYLKHSADVTGVSANTWTSHPFDTEVVDDDTLHSTSSNTSRITFGSAGWRTVSGILEFANTGTGTKRFARIYLNGTTQIWIDGGTAYSTGGTPAEITLQVGGFPYYFAAGDYIELQGYSTIADTFNLGRNSRFAACSI